MMNGEISISSEPGKGSTFHVVLKEVEIAVLVSDKETGTKAINFENIRFEPASILIVDDIEYNRELMALYLKGWDFEIHFAENGREAIEQAGRHVPDLIALDMKMPEMDGYEVMEILRGDEKLKKIPVIAITASALKQDEAFLTKLCNGYLRKPVSREDVVSELMRLLPHTVEKTKGDDDKHLEEVSSAEIIFPSPEEIKKLIHAGNSGNITNLQKYIADIKAMGQQYQPFVDKIETWNQKFEFDKIVAFLKKQAGQT